MSDDQDVQKLKCPNCGYAERFYVWAEVQVTVSGADTTEVLNDDGDTTYGSESTCTCPKCSHTDEMGRFYHDDE